MGYMETKRQRILVVVGQIYDEEYVRLGGHVNGLAVMVRDIYRGVSEHVDCKVLVTEAHIPSHTDGRVSIVSMPKRQPYSLLSMARDVLFLLPKIVGGGIEKARTELWVRKTKRFLLKVIDEWKPQVVNFHDLSYINMRCIEDCLNKGVRCVVTLHLYIGKDGLSHGYEQLRSHEQHVMTMPGVYYSVVSTGMKRRILNDYPEIPENNIYVIVNGSNFVDRIGSCRENVTERKKLLCIGSVSERKNQLQIIRAVKLMTEEERRPVQIVFVGSDNDERIVTAIREAQCGDTLLFKGKVPLSEMDRLYAQAFGTITTSLNEGFGLTVIEGYSRGLPAIFFADLDSYEDLYSPDVAMAITNHSDEAVKDAILSFINKDWDIEGICSFSKRYSMQPVYDKYVAMYEELSRETPFAKND